MQIILIIQINFLKLIDSKSQQILMFLKFKLNKMVLMYWIIRIKYNLLKMLILN
jgi:hypothetical protein